MTPKDKAVYIQDKEVSRLYCRICKQHGHTEKRHASQSLLKKPSVIPSVSNPESPPVSVLQRDKKSPVSVSEENK